MMKLLGICGSLRRESYNGMLLAAAGQCLAAGITMETCSIGEIPLYNNDLDTAEKPEAVQCLLEMISNCDGLVIASPEYNYSIPGLLKNAIDWASRPAYKSVLAGKPAAVLSASGSNVGGARMQMHLRDVLAGTLTPVVPAPLFLVPMAQEKFDREGRLVDGDTQRRLQRYMQDFLQWADVLKKR